MPFRISIAPKDFARLLICEERHVRYPLTAPAIRPRTK